MAFSFRFLRIALFALALLSVSSHAKDFDADEDLVDVQLAQDATQDEQLPNPANWLKSEKGQKLLASFLHTSFPFVDFIGWLAHMDDEDFTAFKELSNTVVSKAQDVMQIVKTAKDFVDPKRVHRLGPVAEGLNHILFKDPNAPVVNKTAMKEAAQQARDEAKKSREEAKQAAAEARLPENRAKAKEAAEQKREQMKNDRKQRAIEAKEQRQNAAIQQKEEAAKARIDAQQQRVDERLQKTEERKRLADERQQKAIEREAAKQTAEELQREVQTRDSLHKTIKMLVNKAVSYLHMNATGGILSMSLSLPIEQEVVPPIMKMRRHGGKEARLLVDTLANISVEEVVESDHFFEALYSKSREVVEVLSDAGHTRPAEIFNVTMPIFSLVKDVGRVFGGSEVVDTARFARLLTGLVEIPELENIKMLQQYRSHASVLARLLEAGSARRAPAKRILAKLGLSYHSDIAPMLADLIFAARDMNSETLKQNTSIIFEDAENMLSYMPGEAMKKSLMACIKFGKDIVKLGANASDVTETAHTIVSLSANLINVLNFMSEPILKQTLDMMRWSLLMVCNMDGPTKAKSFCKDYKGAYGVQKFKRAMGQSFVTSGMSEVKTTKVHHAPTRRSSYSSYSSSSPTTHRSSYSSHSSSSPTTHRSSYSSHSSSSPSSSRLRGSQAAGHSLTHLADQAALVQRAVSIRRSSPPFPAKKIMRWAEKEFPAEMDRLQAAMNFIQKVQWVFSEEHMKIYRTFMKGIQVFKEGQKKLEEMKKAREAAKQASEAAKDQREAKRAERMAKRAAGEKEDEDEASSNETNPMPWASPTSAKETKEAKREADREAAKEARKAARSTPPPKQTPEERAREKVSRTQITNDFDHLMEEFLGLPAVGRKAIEAMIVPEIMQFRKKGGHKTRMLVDEIAKMSFNVTSKEELPAKMMELVEAVRGAGYEKLPKTVDWFKNHGGDMLKLAQQFKLEAAEVQRTGSLNLSQTSRLLHLMSKLKLDQHTKFMLNHFAGIIDAHVTTLGNSTDVMSTLISGVAQTDKTEAKLLSDVTRLMAMATRLVKSPGLYLKKYTRTATLRSLVGRMANISNDMSEWSALNLTKTKKTMFKSSATLLKLMADYREGNEADIARQLAEAVPMPPELSQSVLTVMDSFMTFVCNLKGAEDNLAGCKDFLEEAKTAQDVPLPTAHVVPLAQAQQ